MRRARSFEDPSCAEGAEEERLAVFRRVHGAIAERVDGLIGGDDPA